MVSNNYRECPQCDGEGWYLDDCHDVDVETGKKVYFQNKETCSRCKGEGWIDEELGEDEDPPGAGRDPFDRPSPSTHPEYWME